MRLGERKLQGVSMRRHCMHILTIFFNQLDAVSRKILSRPLTCSHCREVVAESPTSYRGHHCCACLVSQFNDAL